MSSLRSAVVLLVGAVVLAACGGGGDTVAEPGGSGGMAATEGSMGHADGGGGMEASSGYGEPADPADADRTVEVNVDDDLAFEPDTFEVAVDEVVTFRISNTGNVEHEFVLGDEAAQREMAEMMEQDGGHGEGGHEHGGDVDNAVTIHPGETAELTWRFTTPRTVLIGCHVDGHWEAGMRGTVVVS